MFTAQIVLLAATAVAPLASNAAPIFSGMFASNSKRADSNVQLAQGTNFFFANLHLEAQCQPGQVSCISGNLATCSGEANWEITPCTGNNACFAVPDALNTNIEVKCMSESDANAAIAQAGGQGGVSVDFQVTDAPFPDPNAGATPTDGGNDATPTGTDATATDATDAPTGTDDAGEPTETCPPDDGSDDGSDGSDGSDNGDGSDNTDPTPTGTVVDQPTDVPTDPTPTDNCSADEPEETETITLILVPNPTAPGTYETSTFTGDLPEATSTDTASFGVGVGFGPDVPTGTDAATDVPTATATDAAGSDATPTETCTDTEGGDNGSNGDGGYTDGGDAGSTDAPTDGANAPAPTEDLTTSRTTFTAPAPALASPTSSTGVSVIGTHTIPAKRSNSFRFAKVRRA